MPQPRRTVDAEIKASTKFDDARLRYDLLPTDALEELVLVYSIGAAKYGDDNYLKGGLAWRRVIGALERHLASWLMGEKRDHEDGQHHLASAAWCALTLLVYEMRCIGTDDRAEMVRTDRELMYELIAEAAERASERES